MMMMTHRHAVERKLAVHFELIGGCHPSTCVQQDVIELRPNRKRKVKID